MAPSVIFVLGPPGAGKGTQCQRIAERFGYYHISVGELLRQEQHKPGSEHGELIGEYLRNVDWVCHLLKAKMNEVVQNEQIYRFLIDGFPRNMSNLEGWTTYGFTNDIVAQKFVLFFDCPREECERRCLQRNDGRSDDNIDSIRKRFRTYFNETIPVLQYYEQKGLLRRIDANKSKDEVFEDVKEQFR
nr:unnamed protein product [Callosobruchus analis]